MAISYQRVRFDVRENGPMGFALWIEDDLAWAQGTHEYRPMGVAIIASTDLFHTRDFSPRRPTRPRTDSSFVGLFASLGHVNRYLSHTRSQAIPKSQKKSLKRQIAVI